MTKIIGEKEFEAMSSSQVRVNSLYVDSADNGLKFQDVSSNVLTFGEGSSQPSIGGDTPMATITAINMMNNALGLTSQVRLYLDHVPDSISTSNIDLSTLEINNTVGLFNEQP